MHCVSLGRVCLRPPACWGTDRLSVLKHFTQSHLVFVCRAVGPSEQGQVMHCGSLNALCSCQNVCSVLCADSKGQMEGPSAGHSRHTLSNMHNSLAPICIHCQAERCPMATVTIPFPESLVVVQCQVLDAEACSPQSHWVTEVGTPTYLTQGFFSWFFMLSSALQGMSTWKDISTMNKGKKPSACNGSRWMSQIFISYIL